ncbi:MAG TPA: hypothetical protein VF041_21445 [Gemmatimonadaceae bacterium]
MPGTEREEAERAIDRALLDQWDPLGVRETPGPHDEYRRFVPGIYSLLARGGSDVQVTRLLHQLERDELGHPELAARDLTPLVRTLREIERSI